ncbi:DNA cytosine methyltransferase, partial [Serratia symbiotica]|uniref:DNA cytosine methyltransferase n=1 Tax=Serratia symbiotica TaxID=138074 RepID=UPI00188934A9
FFAGIGVWSYALRNAGWPDEKPVWTGSCPCQPFSAAGKGHGFDDERHLWPAFHWLISECRPECIFGEQVASGNANAWFDLVQTDLEAMDYAFGLVPFPSAGVGAPHIRDRAYWVANTDNHRQQPGKGINGRCACSEEGNNPRRCGKVSGLANTPSNRQQCGGESTSAEKGWEQESIGGWQLSERLEGCTLPDFQRPSLQGFKGNEPSEVNGFWRDADWLYCRDEKWRPVEPGTFPLADGASARVGRLRAYGNAIVATVAEAFIASYLDSVQ